MRTLCGLLLASTLASAAGEEQFDGKWWTKVTARQQDAFVLAYMGCAYFEGGRKALARVSDLTVTPAISTYYQTHPRSLNRSIADVLLEIEPNVFHNPPGKGKEQIARYSFYDGDLWRMMDGPGQREAFLDGFLYCFRRLTAKVPAYSKPTPYYVQQLSEWFGVRADDVDEVNVDRVDQKIPDVLRMFADPKVTNAPTTKRR